MKQVLSKVLISILYIIVWVITYLAVVRFFSDSPSRVAYGLISGWWAALYFSLLVEIKIKDLPIIVAILAFISLIGSIINKSLSSYLGDIDECFLFVSPMILNSFICLVKSKYMIYRTKRIEERK